ncbi:ATP-dependent helicase [bacterium]|nr:ATP-dependent helicase [bacterium]
MELSESKKRMLDSTGHLLAIGGPGSGKTTIALIKAAHEIEAGFLSCQQRVIFLSFARATVAQVADQASSLLDKNIRNRIELSTYHSFTWNIIKSHGYLAFGREPIKLLPPPEASARLAAIQSSGTDNALRQLLEEERLLHFDLFASKAGELLARSQKLTSLLLSPYPIIILDEFQDTNSDEWKLIKIIGQFSTLIALADPDQRIYDFRGADPKRISEYADQFTPTTFDFSDENHRSPLCDITQFGNDILSGYNRGKNYNDVNIERTGYYQDRDYNFPLKVQVLNAVKRCKQRDNRNWSIGVFVPTKALMATVSEYLSSERDGLPRLFHEVAVDANGPALAALLIASLLESSQQIAPHKVTVQYLINHMRGKKGNGNVSQSDAQLCNSLESWMHSGRIRGSKREQLLRFCKEITDVCIDRRWTGKPADDWRFVLRKLELIDLQPLVNIISDARFIRLLNKGAILNQKLGDMWQLNGNYLGASEAVSEALLQEHFSMSVVKPLGIHLMTIHKSKGKQFDEVVMSEGYRSGRYLRNEANGPSDKDILEARLILRVGATRAKSHTTILTPSGNQSCRLLI